VTHSKKEDRFIRFEIPIDPNDADGLKSNIYFHKLCSNEPEDLLTYLRNFDKLITDLETAEGPKRFQLFNLTLSPDSQNEWATVLEDIGDFCGQVNL
jgi:hypothetical protein